MDDCLCTHCVKWVDCDKNGSKEYPWGFCILRERYAYTACKKCDSFSPGEPFTEAEFEMFEE